MKTVLTFGTFDLFHPGHAWFLTTAKTCGDYLIVIIARDKNVLAIKGRLPKQTEQQRLENIQKFPAVDKAVLGFLDFKRRFELIEQFKPNVLCLGYDQTSNLPALPNAIKIVRLPAFHPEKYKSSLLM